MLCTSSTIGVPKAFSFSFPPNGPISFCKSSLFGSAWLHPNAPIAEQAWFASFPSAIHPVAEWVSHWITSWFGKSQKCRQSWGRHFWLHQSSGMLYLNMSIDFDMFWTIYGKQIHQTSVSFSVLYSICQVWDKFNSSYIANYFQTLKNIWPIFTHFA